MVTENELPRGIRNNNPGNIRRNNIQWQGMMTEQTDPEFVQFESPEAGERAMGKILDTYKNKYGIDTIEDAISRWAPSNENDTARLIENASKRIGVGAKDKIDLSDPTTKQALLEAIKIQEGTYGDTTKVANKPDINAYLKANKPKGYAENNQTTYSTTLSPRAYVQRKVDAMPELSPQERAINGARLGSGIGIASGGGLKSGLIGAALGAFVARAIGQVKSGELQEQQNLAKIADTAKTIKFGELEPKYELDTENPLAVRTTKIAKPLAMAISNMSGIKDSKVIDKATASIANTLLKDATSIDDVYIKAKKMAKKLGIKKDVMIRFLLANTSKEEAKDLLEGVDILNG